MPRIPDEQQAQLESHRSVVLRALNSALAGGRSGRKVRALRNELKVLDESLGASPTPARRRPGRPSSRRARSSAPTRRR